MLDSARLKDLRTTVMANVAFRPGSSIQGNARRASVGSNWVVAMYLIETSHTHAHTNMHIHTYIRARPAPSRHHTHTRARKHTHTHNHTHTHTHVYKCTQKSAFKQTCKHKLTKRRILPFTTLAHRIYTSTYMYDRAYSSMA